MRSRITILIFMVLAIRWTAAQTADEIAAAHHHLDEWRQNKIPLWMNDFGNLAFYREANQAAGAPSPGQRRVIFFGDSITVSWNLDRSFPGRGYINRGVGGQTTSQMLLRLRQDVIDLRPAVVVILAGTNDIAGNSGPISTADIEANLTTMAELARMHHIAVIFSSLTPVNNYSPSRDMYIERPPARILELNRWLRDYCRHEGLIYLDYFSALVDETGMLRRGLSKGDGLHPNEDCYRIMTPLAAAAVARALKTEYSKPAMR